MTLNKQLQNAILSNNLVIFAGSGLSRRFNLPDWKTLVGNIIFELKIKKYDAFISLMNDNVMSPMAILDLMKLEHSSIHRYIKNEFNITSGDFSLHKKIIDLTGQVITTNFDNAFEKASNSTIIPTIYSSIFNVSEINKVGDPYILKLHGTFNEPDGCVLFSENYESLYSTEKAAIQKLKSIFLEKTILFLGFSFNDPDINLIFSNLDRIFGNNNKHLLVTTEKDSFNDISFIEKILLNDYEQIDELIGTCLDFKQNSAVKAMPPDIQKRASSKIALLYPDPINYNFKEEIKKVIGYFDSLATEIHVGILNEKTLNDLEDFDLLIVISKVFKNKLYFERENLKGDLLSSEQICENITDESLPILFITDEKISIAKNHPAIYLSSFKNLLINKLIHKILKNNDLKFKEAEIQVFLEKIPIRPIPKGRTCFKSIYNNDYKALELDKKSLNNVVGRIEEQSAMALKLLSIISSSKFLNIKASGGIGKTTLTKKIGYELFVRGYFKEGITFKSCESIKSFEDFEELLINGFNLTNILDFKDYLLENYNYQKKDLLIILDNFETVVNSLTKNDFEKVVELLKFATDYSNIVLTSREKITHGDDFEEIYSLTPLMTEDALKLFINHYGNVREDEIQILRSDILEELLNNNPLAIKLVTTSRTRFKHISELKRLLTEHFFESTNSDYSLVFKDTADLNIERTKSIFQSINYSYATLSEDEKLAFELLSLFPDGISLSNFKACFENKKSKNTVSDKALRILRNKSLVEDEHGTLQLQPLIRKFADYQFAKKNNEAKRMYCTEAYIFNSYIMRFINSIGKRQSHSAGIKFFIGVKNNLLNVLKYLPDVEIKENTYVPSKKYLLNFIYLLDDYIVNNKHAESYQEKIASLEDFFSDLPKAEVLLNTINHRLSYYFEEFDRSYKKMSKILSVEQMELRDFAEEDDIISRSYDLISGVHSMEGHTMKFMISNINNTEENRLFSTDFFYLGIPVKIGRNEKSFYQFETDLMFEELNISELETYIDSLYVDYHLEIMQCTYVLSKVKYLKRAVIQKLVVTNPYTNGLKQLMFAFSSEDESQKIKHFETALSHLTHIKYYYLEALYYFCKFLKESKLPFEEHLRDGLNASQAYYYRYLYFKFSSLLNDLTESYSVNFNDYPTNQLEQYIEKYKAIWEKRFGKYDSKLKLMMEV